MVVHLDVDGCHQSHGVTGGYVDDEHILRAAAWLNQRRGAKGTWDDWCLRCLSLARKRSGGHAITAIFPLANPHGARITCECSFVIIGPSTARALELHSEHVHGRPEIIGSDDEAEGGAS